MCVNFEFKGQATVVQSVFVHVFNTIGVVAATLFIIYINHLDDVLVIPLHDSRNASLSVATIQVMCVVLVPQKFTSLSMKASTGITDHTCLSIATLQREVMKEVNVTLNLLVTVNVLASMMVLVVFPLPFSNEY